MEKRNRIHRMLKIAIEKVFHVENLEVKMAKSRVKIISNESGDWEILRCDEFEASGHRLSSYDYKELLEYLGYDCDIEEISDEEMEEIS